MRVMRTLLVQTLLVRQPYKLMGTCGEVHTRSVSASMSSVLSRKGRNRQQTCATHYPVFCSADFGSLVEVTAMVCIS